MNIDELNGADLDYEVAKAEGFAARICRMYGLSYCRVDTPEVGYQVYQPTGNTKLAADIAFKRHYTLYPRLDRCGNGEPPQWIWLAEAQQNPIFHGQFVDPSAPVAICRLRVAEAQAERSIQS